MGRHNRKGNEYPNAYVFHVEVVPAGDGHGGFVGEVWLGPWCVWRSILREENERLALETARVQLSSRITLAFAATV